jgi:hypothetical protein
VQATLAPVEITGPFLHMWASSRVNVVQITVISWAAQGLPTDFFYVKT